MSALASTSSQICLPTLGTSFVYPRTGGHSLLCCPCQFVYHSWANFMIIFIFWKMVIEKAVVFLWWDICNWMATNHIHSHWLSLRKVSKENVMILNLSVRYLCNVDMLFSLVVLTCFNTMKCNCSEVPNDFDSPRIVMCVPSIAVWLHDLGIVYSIKYLLEVHTT